MQAHLLHVHAYLSLLNRLHQAVYARCLERERRLLEAPSVAPELKNLNLGDWNEPFAKKPTIFVLMQKILDKGVLNVPAAPKFRGLNFVFHRLQRGCPKTEFESQWSHSRSHP